MEASVKASGESATKKDAVPWVDHPQDERPVSQESVADNVTDSSIVSTDSTDSSDDSDVDDTTDASTTDDKSASSRSARNHNNNAATDSDGDSDVEGKMKRSGSVILQTLQQKPKKKKNMDDSEKEEYKKEKKEWREKKKELKKSMSPNEKKEYHREKRELTMNDKNERKKQREERRRAMKEKRKMHNKPKIGKIVTKETKSYELVCDMLLGIRVTVSKVAPRKQNAEVSQKDYEVTNLRFPSAGSSNGTYPTPAHQQRDFSFRDYAPAVFRRIREHFGIESADYLMSLTADYLLSELISPGQSGQFFYFSYDLRFMLKTLTKSEARFLKGILPKYYDHIMKNPDSLMARFFGFHRVAPHGHRKHYFIVMGNIFAQNVEIMYRFDLKGSTVGRVTAPEKIKNDPNVVMKDQDFDNMNRSLILGPEKAQIFKEQVKRDVKFLEKLGIMDYSLLIGIHDLKRAQKVDRRRSLSMVYIPSADVEFNASTGFNGESDLDWSESDTVEYKQHHVTAFTRDQGGFRSTDEENRPCDEIYFIGIIDILQPYNMRKIAEHSFKSLRYDGSQISAVAPKAYAKRFRDFMFAHIRVPEGVEGEAIVEDAADDDLLEQEEGEGAEDNVESSSEEESEPRSKKTKKQKEKKDKKPAEGKPGKEAQAALEVKRLEELLPSMSDIEGSAENKSKKAKSHEPSPRKEHVKAKEFDGKESKKKKVVSEESKESGSESTKKKAKKESSTEGASTRKKKTEKETYEIVVPASPPKDMGSVSKKKKKTKKEATIEALVSPRKDTTSKKAKKENAVIEALVSPRKETAKSPPKTKVPKAGSASVERVSQDSSSKTSPNLLEPGNKPAKKKKHASVQPVASDKETNGSKRKKTKKTSDPKVATHHKDASEGSDTREDVASPRSGNAGLVPKQLKEQEKRKKDRGSAAGSSHSNKTAAT